jgi:hypothetical protein
MAYLIVLTERATQIAKSEEDGPRTESADQWGLLSKVGVIASNSGPSTGFTETCFIIQAVNCTLSGAKTAFLQQLNCFIGQSS